MVKKHNKIFLNTVLVLFAFFCTILFGNNAYAADVTVTYENRPSDVYEGDWYYMKIKVNNIPSGVSISNYQWQAVYLFSNEEQITDLEDNSRYCGTKTSKFGYKTDVGDATSN